jgi:hypothetical protein
MRRLPRVAGEGLEEWVESDERDVGRGEIPMWEYCTYQERMESSQ